MIRGDAGGVLPQQISVGLGWFSEASRARMTASR